MTILGIILLILGFVFAIKILWIIGVILLIVGLVRYAGFGSYGGGATLGGRRHWY